MKFSAREIKDIGFAWAMISLAFAILFTKNLIILPAVFVFSGITVGVAFVVHELCHKYIAQRYRLWAEFRAEPNMLILAVLMSFFGFVFVAPGAVLIGGRRVSVKENGKISAAGPLSNIILALLFFGISTLTLPHLVLTIAKYGVLINSWLALFNMIPFWMFDGKKIFRWNKVIWGTMVGVSLLLVGASGSI